MMTFLDAALSYTFLQNAVLGGMLASLGCGMMGTYVVVKRMGYLAGGIAHAVLGGMGIAYFFGQPPLGGALVAAVIAALLIGWVRLQWRQQEDTLIGAVWAIGMALGILFISQTPGYNVDLMSYLFGNILMIPQEDLYLMAGLDATIFLTVGLFYKQLLAISFDEEFARVRGLPVEMLYLLLLCLVALTVVLLIKIVGLILVLALLTLPAAIATQFFGSLKPIMCLAMILGIVFTTGGLALAYEGDLPAGSVIILLAGLSYVLSTILTRWGAWRSTKVMTRDN